MKSAWHAISTAELRKVGRHASTRERGNALKRASAIYRGATVRSNPSGGSMLKLGLIGAAAYLGYKTFIKKGTTTPTTGDALGQPVNTVSRLPF